MVGVAARYGETHAGASYLLPVSVDGLVVVASISLVEITGRIRAATMPPPIAVPEAPNAAAPSTGREQTAVSPAAAAITRSPSEQATAAPASGDDQPDHATIAGPVPTSGGAARPPRANQHERVARPQRASRPVDRSAHTSAEGSRRQAAALAGTSAQKADDEPVPSDTAAAVAYWYRRDPALHPADIAARIGRSERTVRRYWPPPSASGRVNGQQASTLADSIRR